MKPSTIIQVVEALLSTKPQTKKEKVGNKLLKITMTSQENKANEATIWWNTFNICEAHGIDRAMEYFNGVHYEEEYKEFQIGKIDKISLCKSCWCMTKTNGAGFCMKCGADKLNPEEEVEHKITN